MILIVQLDEEIAIITLYIQIDKVIVLGFYQEEDTINMPRNVIMFEVDEQDNLVSSTYGRVYNFQQQNGCKDRGIYYFTVPIEDYYIEDYEREEIPEEVNGEIKGVSFKAWLERDPNTPNFLEKYRHELFWDRNFYPHVSMIIKDLENKGILKEGEYIINIDW